MIRPLCRPMYIFLLILSSFISLCRSLDSANRTLSSSQTIPSSAKHPGPTDLLSRAAILAPPRIKQPAWSSKPYLHTSRPALLILGYIRLILHTPQIPSRFIPPSGGAPTPEFRSKATTDRDSLSRFGAVTLGIRIAGSYFFSLSRMLLRSRLGGGFFWDFASSVWKVVSHSASRRGFQPSLRLRTALVRAL